jgi:hypothetical protein
MKRIDTNINKIISFSLRSREETFPIVSNFQRILVLSLIILLFFTLPACKKSNQQNPNIPRVNINLTVDPNSTLFLELNSVGGWIYLDEVPGMYIPPPSRGVMVYRQDVDLFLAYERQPPNTPDECCNTQQGCTRLIIGNNFPFVKDTCTETLYNLLDGTIFDGEGRYPLIRYNAYYDGATLFISN